MTSTAPKSGRPCPLEPSKFRKSKNQAINAVLITNSHSSSIMANHIIINGVSVENAKKKESVFVVVLTSDNYLAGVILLHYSILRYSSYPLVVAVVESRVSPETIQVLRESGCKVRFIDYLEPRVPSDLIAERFRDTWTKLRVFGMDEFERIVMVDADMILQKTIDELFTMQLPGNDWIAATHACVCNKKRAPWGAKRPDWNENNCPFTPLKHPEALTTPTKSCGRAIPSTWRQLNSGLVVLKPSKEIFNKMEDFLHNSPLVKDMGFPDQDFLVHFFHDKWKALGWQYNAPKNMRHWHTNIWNPASDDEVKVIHYIVDKPWMKALGVKHEDYYVTSIWWDTWREYVDSTPKVLVDRVKKTMPYVK